MFGENTILVCLLIEFYWVEDVFLEFSSSVKKELKKMIETYLYQPV